MKKGGNEERRGVKEGIKKGGSEGGNEERRG
mgnify:CR=1 FL=1